MARKIVGKRSDPQALQLRKVRDGKDRSLVFCEGEKLVEELFQSSWLPRSLFCTSKKVPLAERLAPKDAGIPIIVLSDDVMEFCSDTTSPQGIIALAKPPQPPVSAAPTKAAALTLLIHGVQLPQNVGALLRVSEAAGVKEVFVSGASADPWGPKALRGASGSAFRMPIRRFPSFIEALDNLRSRGIRSIAASQNAGMAYDRVDWKMPSALVLGSEGKGFAESEIKMVDQTVRIPMMGRIESLNVATAAAVCLFEAARQRNYAVEG